MKMKPLFLGTVIIFSLVLATLAVAGDTPQPVLKPGDVEHFIKTFPIMSDDFEKFGAQYEARSGDLSIPDALKANEQFHGVLKKHGWDELFFQKFSAIMMGYSAIAYKSEMAKAEPEIREALKEIESNPALSEEMKKQIMNQMKMAQSALSQQQEMWGTQIHPKDIELVRPFVEKLKRVLEDN